MFFCAWSLEIANMRLKEQEAISCKPSQSLKACFINYYPNRNVKWLRILCTPLTHKWWQNIAKDEYESNFISAVVPPGEIGVKFDDIGALEDVKKALNELVILPMRRPELFSHGNLLRVLICSFYVFWSGLDGICGVLFHYVILWMLLLALQRNITFWASWNWENPSCQGTCNGSWGELYQHNWFNSYIKGMQKRRCYIILACLGSKY